MDVLSYVWGSGSLDVMQCESVASIQLSFLLRSDGKDLQVALQGQQDCRPLVAMQVGPSLIPPRYLPYCLCEPTPATESIME